MYVFVMRQIEVTVSKLPMPKRYEACQRVLRTSPCTVRLCLRHRQIIIAPREINWRAQLLKPQVTSSIFEIFVPISVCTVTLFQMKITVNVSNEFVLQSVYTICIVAYTLICITCPFKQQYDINSKRFDSRKQNFN